MDESLRRYHRQMLLPDFGEEGQRRLRASHALIVGCGALGCAAADALCRAGVGGLTIIDRDVVELTNLQRQSLFEERDAAEGAPKAIAAAARLARVNSEVRIRPLVADFSAATALGAIAPVEAGGPRAQVLIDATDNFETRYLLNDLAVREGIPLIYGGVVATGGTTMTILPRAPAGGAKGASAPRDRAWPTALATPCFRCLQPDPPAPGTFATCDTAGVLGPAVTIVAALQAAEAFKVLLGRWDLVSRGLRAIDVWSGGTRSLDVSGAWREGECPACGRGEFEWLDGSAGAEATALCGRASVQVRPGARRGAGGGAEAGDDSAPGGARVSLAEVAARLRPHGAVQETRFLVRATLRDEQGDAGEPIVLTVFPDARALVGGTSRPERARAVYARYVGS